MIDFKYIITDFYKVFSSGGTIQDFINRRYKSPNPKQDEYIIGNYATHVKIQNDFLLPISQYHAVVQEVFTEYDYSDLRDTDIVLDIGAHTGIFSLVVRNKVKHVYSVEPVFYTELLDNLILNQTTNITPFNYALSLENTEISFMHKTNFVLGKTLSQLKELCGCHVDFLKCDCEGGEWRIQPEEFDGIRRIEMEVHNFGGENLYDYPEMLEYLGYDVRVQERDEYTILVHARLKN